MTEIAARRHIEPYQQGELDYLCGMYATINAIRLLREGFASMSSKESENLLAEGARYLSEDLHLTLTSGMEPSVHYDLTQHLANIVSAKSTYTIKVERAELPEPAPIKAAFKWIDTSLSAGKPVLIFFENKPGHTIPDHYTVVAGSTASTLLLFDSCGMRWLRKDTCGVDPDGRRIISLLRLAVEQSD